ncbi:MAG: hypothetical protein AAF268_00445 [Cyanobacteria bacterium P01_A01_bin.3]
MEQRWFRLAAGFVLGSFIAFNPLAAVAQAGTIWRGTGQIVSGQGHGASLRLEVETDGGRIRTRSGPALDATFSGGNETFHNSEGTWQIDRRGERLNITLYRGEQVIRYQLSPDGKGNDSPQTTGDKPADSNAFELNTDVPSSLGSRPAG